MRQERNPRTLRAAGRRRPAARRREAKTIAMEGNSAAANRALDAKCASERSLPSRIVVTKLKAMLLEDKTRCLVR